MEVSEFQALTSAFLRYGVEGIIAGVVVFLLLKHFLPGYLSEKGKNLATREDVAAITEEVQRVESQYAVLLEELKSKHQLRLAAIDRRLDAHQQAFSLWRDLLSATNTPDVDGQVAKCQSWWRHNCLYLEPEAREAFTAAYSAASIHGTLLGMRDDPKEVKDNWEIIKQAGPAILKAAQLPGLTSAEKNDLVQIESEHAPHKRA